VQVLGRVATAAAFPWWIRHFWSHCSPHIWSSTVIIEQHWVGWPGWL